MTDRPAYVLLIAEHRGTLTIKGVRVPVDSLTEAQAQADRWHEAHQAHHATDAFYGSARLYRTVGPLPYHVPTMTDERPNP